MSFKPLLAATLDGVDPTTLSFPLYWSPKLDGIRTLMVDGANDKNDQHVAGIQPATRKIKQLPNLKIRERLSDLLLAGFDGELISGSVTDKDVFNSTTRIVMKGEGPDMNETVWLYTEGVGPKAKSKMSFTPIEADASKGISDVREITETRFFVFDDFSMKGLPFSIRYANLETRISQLPDDLREFVVLVKHETVTNADDLMNVERVIVEANYEGVMLRNPGGGYKYGRSTLNEQTLVKMKRFADTDGIVVGFEEMMHNDNEKTRDALGHGKRSSHAENMRPANMLGALLVRLPEFGDQIVKCGSGFTEDMKKAIWGTQADWLNAGVVLKYQPSGMKDLPRFPVFKDRRAD